jgi:hypothetical protein
MTVKANKFVDGVLSFTQTQNVKIVDRIIKHLRTHKMIRKFQVGGKKAR